MGTREAERQHNLPAELTSFIGREQDLAELRGLLRERRLLTLTGAGGVGKTRLALELARAGADDYDRGAWLVELADLTHPALVVDAVESALHVPEVPGQPMLETLVASLRDQE